MEEQLPSPPDLEGTLGQAIEILRKIGIHAGESVKALSTMAHAWELAGLECRRIAGQLSKRAKELRYEAEGLLLEVPSEPEESDEKPDES